MRVREAQELLTDLLAQQSGGSRPSQRCLRQMPLICCMVQCLYFLTGVLVCRARELLNDLLASESGPSIPIAEADELSKSAGLVSHCK